VNFFTVAFYGVKILGCKTPQLCVTPCECLSTKDQSDDRKTISRPVSEVEPKLDQIRNANQ
jgi:hypothetical protein